jgi:RNA polymerase sigma-70 factor (ECF subfamily)
VSSWVEAGRSAWPELAAHVDAEAFSAWGRAREVGEAVRAGDLFLACACAAGAPGALEIFERTILARVGSFVARIDGSAAFADELRQSLRTLLFVGAAPKIADYAGRGPLEAWIRVVATREALRLKRSQAAAAEPPSLPGGDPELSYIKDRYRGEVAAALGDALASLAPEARAALKLYYLEGLTLEQIAALYGVHASTIWRRIGAAHEQVLEGLRARLALPAGEADSLVGLVRSRLDVSLSGLLRTR